MSKQPVSEWDKMVCEKLAETDRQIAAGTLETIPAAEAHRRMDAYLAKAREEEAQEQQRRYRLSNPFTYAGQAF